MNFVIADTNVIRYDKTTAQFIAKDSSSTHITFTYKGFSDTVFIILTIPDDNVCPANASVTVNYANGENKSIYAGCIDAINQIRNASKITYQAENAIFLNPGFYVDNTSNVFKAQIGGCPNN